MLDITKMRRIEKKLGLSKIKSSEKLSRVVSECLLDVKECGKDKGNGLVIHGKSLQDAFLETLRRNGIPILVFLINGIKLQCYLDNFDQDVLTLKNSLTHTVVGQVVYKRAIATIMPIYPVELPETLTDEK